MHNYHRVRLGVSRLLVVILIGASISIVMARPASACSSSGVPSVTTDKQDYGAGETVVIDGAGYACGVDVTVAVTGPDATTTTWTVTTGTSAGAFSTTYQLGYENVSGKFDVVVSDAAGVVLATAVFYDSHFRFGHLSYVKTGASSASFTLKSAFRRDAYVCRSAPAGTVVACTGPGGRAGPGDYILETIGTTGLNFGDGTSTSTLLFRVDAIDVAGNWLLGRALHPGTTNTVISKTYASAGTFIANVDDCCRITALVNASNAQYRVQTLVDFTKSNVDSPQSSMPAVVDCPVSALCTFTVPAADSDATDLSFRLSTFAESGIPAQPAGAAISTAGVYSWNTTGRGPAGTLYATQVMIEEKSGSTLVSRSAVDFIIRLVSGTPPVFDVPPTPASGSTIAATAGSLASFTVQASDPDTGQAVTVGHLGLPSGATLNCATSPTNPRTCTFNWTPTAGQGGNHIVTFTAQDPTGLNASPHAITLNVATNRPPSVDAGSGGSGDEGSAISLLATVSDPDGDAVTTTWTYAAGAGVDTGATCTFGDASAVDTTITCTDDGSYTVTVSGSDGKAPAVTDNAVVTVANVSPDLGPLSAPAAPVAVNTSVSVSGTFTDPGANDTHTCSVDWGDTSSPTGSVSAGTCSASRTYAAPGVYTVTMTVTDDDGDSDTAIFQYVVVYDPDAGFITGGGWIDSPAGAYAADPSLTGKATFGFVSKYKKGATTPEGNTQFQFHAGNLNFHSSTYEWLVVSGPKGQYKGTGTINGQGSYGFLLTAHDGQVIGGGGVDKFRIKIWDKTTGAVVYDNQVGTSDDAAASDAIEGGSIVIHTKK